MKRDDFDLKREFEKDIQLPDSLSKNNIVRLIEAKGVKQTKIKKVKILPKVLSAAAVMAVVVLSAMSIGMRSEFVAPVSPQDTSQSQTSAPAADSTEKEAENETTTQLSGEKSPATKTLKCPKTNEDLRNHILRLYTEETIKGAADDFIDRVADFFEYGAVGSDEAVLEYAADVNLAPTAALAQATGASTNTAFGTTNNQIADVEEGDIIENDGRYLYIVYSGTDIAIVDTENMLRLWTGSIICKSDEEPDGKMIIRDIYVNDNRLTVLCNYSEEAWTVVYDISHKSAPKEIFRSNQDGSYMSSRMVNGILYTISEYYVYGNSREEFKERAIPKTNGEEISCDCCFISTEDSRRYIVLTACDTKKDAAETSSVCILSDAFDVFSTADTLYLYGCNYSQDGICTTDIYSFSLEGTKITQTASGSIKGNAINQYAFDEYKGYLRVAAHYYDYRSNIDVSNVYILNKNLEVVGELTDLAYDEQIKAVRFMGDTGYVVTFRNTDPLFILDLSNPAEPKATGELKIPGYSSYIHPLTDNYLVGIGYDGTEENADFNTVKVSVFDVSDKTKPLETDTFVIKDCSTTVNSNPKAFFYYREKNMIAIPVNHYGENGKVINSLQTLTIEEGKITSHLGYIHSSPEYSPEAPLYDGYYSSYSYYYYMGYNPIFRGTYIGDMLYTIDNTAVNEHSLITGERENVCLLKDSEEIKEELNDKPTANGAVEMTTSVTVSTDTTLPPVTAGEGTTAAIYTTAGAAVSQAQTGETEIASEKAD